MKIVEKTISELKASEYNPRKLSDAQAEDLSASLQKFGFVDPVVVNMFEGRENTIIGGHQRVKTWQGLGLDTVPCVEVNLNEENERELNIRLNKSGGDFDMDLLVEFFEKDELKGWGFEDFELGGFDAADNFGDKNSEVNIDDLDDAMKLSLTFTPEQYGQVVQRLSSYDDSPAIALMKVLNVSV